MKYIIKRDAGYGDSWAVVDADNLEEAKKLAYEEWREEAENNADHDAFEWTQEMADDYGL